MRIPDLEQAQPVPTLVSVATCGMLHRAPAGLSLIPFHTYKTAISSRSPVSTIEPPATVQYVENLILAGDRICASMPSKLLLLLRLIFFGR